MNARFGFKSAATRLIAPVLGTLMLAAIPAEAASISYFLDQSNSSAYPDGVPYLQVTIADGADGAIDFTVQTLGPLAGAAGTNSGIQSFAFNVTPGGDAEGANIGGLPEAWNVKDHDRMSQFGFFDIKVYGNGSSRLSTLTFSILAIDGDTPEDYAVLSTGNVPNDHSFFAAHLAGGFFAGNAPVSAVPVPAAAWLFATGAAAVVARARKRKL